MLTYAMDARGDQSKYEYLRSCIRDDIVAARLLPDEKLPSKRALATHLGLSVLTVENAYQQLTAEGYLYTRPRCGFFVSGAAPRPSGLPEPPGLPQSAVGAAVGSSAVSEYAETDFPFQSYARILRRVLAQQREVLLEKPPHAGCMALRQAISGHLRRYRGMDAPPERIVVGSGAEYLYVLLAQLFGRDTVIGLEYPSYEKIRQVYESLGAACELLPMDADGIATKALAETRAGVLHVTPYHSFPSGVSASAAKRREYLAWAAKTGGYLIEDDFDSEFRMGKKPLETIYSMDTAGCVIYCNTFSKSMAASLRLGYMVLPERIYGEYQQKLGFYSCTVPAIDQMALAAFIREGYFERHLNRLRRQMTGQ